MNNGHDALKDVVERYCIVTRYDYHDVVSCLNQIATTPQSLKVLYKYLADHADVTAQMPRRDEESTESTDIDALD